MTAPLRHPVPVDDRRPHAIVIGSGFGGLAAAIRLGARGYRVTVLERHDQPGGRARVFRRLSDEVTQGDLSGPELADIHIQQREVEFRFGVSGP